MSDKKNLTRAEILVVADLLISKDAISYFLNNCHLIYKGQMPFSAKQPLVCNNSIKTAVIVALDTVQDLLKGNRICPLVPGDQEGSLVNHLPQALHLTIGGASHCRIPFLETWPELALWYSRR